MDCYMPRCALALTDRAETIYRRPALAGHVAPGVREIPATGRAEPIRGWVPRQGVIVEGIRYCRFDGLRGRSCWARCTTQPADGLSPSAPGVGLVYDGLLIEPADRNHGFASFRFVVSMILRCCQRCNYQGMRSCHAKRLRIHSAAHQPHAIQLPSATHDGGVGTLPSATINPASVPEAPIQ